MINDNKDDLFRDLPPLVPIDKKRLKVQEVVPKSANPTKVKDDLEPFVQEIGLNILETNITQSRQPTPKGKMLSIPSANRDISIEKLEQIRKHNIKEKQVRNERDLVHVQSLDRDIHKTKRAVSQMINKVAVKNVSDEMLPISSETIHKNIRELQIEIQELIEREVALSIEYQNHPTNSIISREMQQIKNVIEKYETLKILYQDKLELRSENKRLLEIIQQLKQENHETKAKIIKGIDRIGDNMHYLPCEREKNLMIQLDRVRAEFMQEHQMRVNLEENVSKTIQNFARLYDEADTARKIIVSKLKSIEAAEEHLQSGHQGGSPLQSEASVKATKMGVGKEIILEDSPVQTTSRMVPSNNFNFNLVAGRTDETQRRNENHYRKPSNTPLSKDLNLEDKINKMRSNQATFKKMRF